MELYESDLSLSLFGGDLLAGLSSSVDNDTDLPELLQDGYQVDTLKPQAPAAEPLAEYELSSSPLESSFQPVQHASEGLFGSRWLDINTDLLDLLEESQPEEPLEPSNLSSLIPAPTHQGSTALEILQSLADDTERSLSTSPVPPVEQPRTASEDSNNIAGSSVLMGMLLEGLESKAEEPIVLGNYMNVDVDEQLVLEASLAPILSPVSPEDVESLLSSGPCSPSSAVAMGHLLPPASLSFETLSEGSEYVPSDESADESWLPSPSPSPSKIASKSKKASPRASTRSTPYTKAQTKPKIKLSKEAKQEERRLRKKQQNRDAALRYRQKKKEEGNTVFSECEILEERNRELKNQADGLAREIKYLKDLMADVYQAKKLLKVKPKK